ncbi:MAG: serine/threonine-protein kinase [Pseudomonadota bacterium]
MSGIAPLPNGTHLGDEFRIERMLGRGGFGITYLVKSLKDLDERVRVGDRCVVKEFALADCVVRSPNGMTLEPLGRNPDEQDAYWRFFDEQLGKFDLEARTLARFRHANIVEVFLIRSANRTAYMVMEFVDGQPLSARQAKLLRDRGCGLSWPELRPIAKNLLDALEYIHARDVIHRDIKPDNIMLRGDGDAVLIDFGGARATSRARGSMVFTPGLAAGEQIYNYLQARKHQGKAPNKALADVNATTDIYGLAASFYMAMTGTAPYATNEDMHITEHRPALREHPWRDRLQIPDGVADAIDAALNLTDASARPQTVGIWRDLFPDFARRSSSPGQGPRPAAGRDPDQLFNEAEGLRWHAKSEQAIQQCLQLYREASEHGHGPALYRLGRLYQVGDLVPENISVALEYFLRAADAGDVRAQYRVAEHDYRCGTNAADAERAYRMARRAADGGLAAAMNLVGRFYRQGVHVPQNDAKACDWYEAALRHGDADGAQNLAAMYRRGLGRRHDAGVSRSLTEAADRLRAGADPREVLSDTPPFGQTKATG